jgi:hypothetical protein
LFFQDIAGKQNGVLVNKCTSTEGNSGAMFIPVNRPDFEKLKRSIFQFLTGIEVPSEKEFPNDSESTAYLGRIYKEMWVDSWRWVQDPDPSKKRGILNECKSANVGIIKIHPLHLLIEERAGARRA